MFFFQTASSTALLKGQIYEALDNRVQAICYYKQALKLDVHNYQAFDLLVKHQMLTSKEGTMILVICVFRWWEYAFIRQGNTFTLNLKQQILLIGLSNREGSLSIEMEFQVEFVTFEKFTCEHFPRGWHVVSEEAEVRIFFIINHALVLTCAIFSEF